MSKNRFGKIIIFTKKSYILKILTLQEKKGRDWGVLTERCIDWGWVDWGVNHLPADLTNHPDMVMYLLYKLINGVW